MELIAAMVFPVSDLLRVRGTRQPTRSNPSSGYPDTLLSPD